MSFGLLSLSRGAVINFNRPTTEQVTAGRANRHPWRRTTQATANNEEMCIRIE